MRYLFNLPPGKIWLKVILMWGAMHKSSLMHGRHKKCLIPSAFSYRGTSGAQQWHQSNKANIAWEDGPLGPGKSDKMLNTTYPGCAPEDGILCLSESGSSSLQGTTTDGMSVNVTKLSLW